MKSFYVIVVCLLKIVESQMNIAWRSIFFNDSFNFREAHNIYLNAFIDYADSSYLQNEPTNSAYCVVFSLDSFILKYSCHQNCSDLSFASYMEDPDTNRIIAKGIGPKHCRMGGNISRAYIMNSQSDAHTRKL